MSERRQTERVQVLLQASVTHDNGVSHSRVADVSEVGARVIGPPLDAGAEVKFLKGQVDVPATVVWSRDATSGLSFDHRVPKESLLRTISSRRRYNACGSAGARPGFGAIRLTEGERAWLAKWERSSSHRLGD